MAGRILVVDGVPTNRITMKVRLTSACYEVSAAGSGAEALRTAALAHPQIVLIGASLPDMTGAELCAALRAALLELGGRAAADTVRVLYGGSVAAKNVGEIVAQTDVDGALAVARGDTGATLLVRAAVDGEDLGAATRGLSRTLRRGNRRAANEQLGGVAFALVFGVVLPLGTGTGEAGISQSAL